MDMFNYSSVKYGLWPIIILVMVSMQSLHMASASRAPRPNFLILMADDLGIGDIGCYGNTTIRTPNIDRLQREGVKLTHHLSAAYVCTPSRAAFMTGRYPARVGFGAKGVMPAIAMLASVAGLPSEEITFAKLLRDKANYKTGLIGKWHLGLNKAWYGDFLHHPHAHGFDFFYGIPLSIMKDFGKDNAPMFESMFPNLQLTFWSIALIGLSFIILLRKYGGLNMFLVILLTVILVILPITFSWVIRNLGTLNSVMFRNFDVVEQPIRLETIAPRFVAESTDFLRNRSHDGSPFLLFVSFSHVHTPLVTTKRFNGVSKHGLYGDNVEEMDWMIGEILAMLDILGFRNNTMVYFTSDNGGHVEEVGNDGDRHGGYNGIYKGGKLHGTFDGGVRAPGIIRWPGRVRENTIVPHVTSLMDIFPTIVGRAGLHLPDDRIIDGKDMWDIISVDTNSTHERHEFLFGYCSAYLREVRYMPRGGTSVYKLIFWKPAYVHGRDVCLYTCLCPDAVKVDPPELYDLTSDPSETSPLDTTLPEHQSIVETMVKARNDHSQKMHGDDKLSLSGLIWRPWLQPCCNFPFCDCVEEKYRYLLDLEKGA